MALDDCFTASEDSSILCERFSLRVGVLSDGVVTESAAASPSNTLVVDDSLS